VFGHLPKAKILLRNSHQNLTHKSKKEKPLNHQEDKDNKDEKYRENIHDQREKQVETCSNQQRFWKVKRQQLYC
jgi:hypothetical protein